MGVVQATFPIDRFPAFQCADVAVWPLDIVADANAAAALASRCAASDREGAFKPAAASLAAEFAWRPGRRVWGWLARPVADSATAVGLVSLVVVDVGAQRRCSIGWLVVDPGFRRRGVGWALVSAAVGRARDLGAGAVHVDTLDRWTAAVSFWQAVRLAAEPAPATLPASGESRKTAEGRTLRQKY